MADVRMTATERAWLSWGRPGEPEGAAGPGGLALVFQPIFDLATERVVGIEAQACQPVRGADQELSQLRSALADLALVPASIPVSLHLSACMVVDARVACLLRGAGRDAKRLVVEIVDDGRCGWPALQAPVARLRRLGARIAVNDGLLRQMPGLVPDVVKLDATVVRAIDTDPLRQALASTLVLLADALGATVCAEAVETSSELDQLRRIGVHHGQGHHLGRPAPLPWTVGALVWHPSTGAVFT